ncbi:hypothetical protein Tco_0723435 [Tanacetum coccineum]
MNLQQEVDIHEEVIGKLDLHGTWTESEVDQTEGFYDVGDNSFCSMIEEKLSMISSEKVALEDLLKRANIKFSNGEKFVELYEKYGRLFKEAVFPKDFQAHLDDFDNNDGRGDNDDDGSDNVEKEKELADEAAVNVEKDSVNAEKEGEAVVNEEQEDIFEEETFTQKVLVERGNVGFDLTKSNLCPSFIEDLTAKGVGLHVADSHTGNHRGYDFTPLETIRRFLGIIRSRSLSARRGGLRARGEEGGVGDEGGSPSTRSMNNEAPMIDADPLTTVDPSEFPKNIGDSDDASSEQDEVTLIDRTTAEKTQNRRVSASSKATGKRKQTVESSEREPQLKVRKVSSQASKVAGDASDPLDVDSAPDIHGNFLASYVVYI